MLIGVKAYRAAEGIVIRQIEAADVDDAKNQIECDGFKFIAATAKNHSGLNATRRFSIVLFTQELSSLLGAGLPLLDALHALAAKQDNRHQKLVYEQLLRHLADGHPLSVALERSRAGFPRLYVAMIRASERTGDVTDAMSRYLAYQRQVETIQKKIISSTVYPALLMVVGSLVVGFLLIWVTIVIPGYG